MNDFYIFSSPKEEEGNTFTRPVAQTEATVGNLRTFDIFGTEGEAEPQNVETQTEQVLPEEPVDIFAKYGEEAITDEMILADPNLMNIVDTALKERFGGRSNLAGVATGLAGGATASYEGKTPEERLEIWNNWQRSFSGGQSVTTLNEVAFMQGATEEQKLAVGASYDLFDRKANIFTGPETWGETFDGIGDYIKAAIYDPVTFASFGVGKALSAGGTKAAAQALKATAVTAFRSSLAQGATREAARQAAKEATKKGFASLGAKTVAKYSAVDFAANVGSDIAYQNVLIDAKAQDEYSFVQTGVAALGTIAMPSLIAATKGVDALAVGARQASAKLPAGKRGVFEAFVDVQRKFGHLGPDDITNAVKQRTNTSQISASLKNTFQNFSQNLNNYTPWTQAKVDAGKILNQNGVALTAGENQNLFWKSFLFGDTTGTQKGFAQELSDAGFVYVPRGKDDKITNFIGDAMSWLDDATVKKVVEDFENSVGKTFDGTIDTAEKLSAAFKNRQSLFGSGLADSKQVQDILKKGGTVAQLAQGLSKQVDEAHPEVGQYVLSVWKRLVTAHPATTGANVKGWAATAIMNSASDVMLGGLKLGEAAVYKMAGKQGAYEAALNASKGSVIGAIKRGYNLFTPNTTMEAAEGYLMLKPGLYEQIIKESSGGVDGQNVLKALNIDPNNKAANLTEKTVTAMQHITGARLQDEVTKLLSFQSALEQGIMREYGESFNQFMSRPDAYTEMFSPRFKERVDAWAMNRTLRETSSKSWSQKEGRGVFLAVAKGIEGASRNPVGGYAIPFGSFMNTALATLGDYSGFNAVKHLTARGLSATDIAPTTFNFAEEEGMELLAKGIVGWSAVSMYLPQATEKVEAGLTWNQKPRDDGSVADITYDFPLSYVMMISQMAAHYIKDGEVPKALAEEAFLTLGGQPFRQMDDSARQSYEVVQSVLTGDYDATLANSLEVLSGLGSRIISGALRPLDPVNQAAILMSDDYTQVDRKQASNKFLAESFKYVDQIFGGIEAPAAATPTRGFDLGRPDPGRLLGGVRSARNPNAIERMLASVGKASWQTGIQWGGDDQVKNTMDGILGPILNAEAERMLQSEPDFFDMDLPSKEKRVKEVTTRAENITKQVLEYSFSSEDTLIKLKRELSQVDKTDLKRAMNYLGYEGDPMDLAKEEGGANKLEMLIYFSKNFDALLVE